MDTALAVCAEGEGNLERDAIRQRTGKAIINVSFIMSVHQKQPGVSEYTHNFGLDGHNIVVRPFSEGAHTQLFVTQSMTSFHFPLLLTFSMMSLFLLGAGTMQSQGFVTFKYILGCPSGGNNKKHV